MKTLLLICGLLFGLTSNAQLGINKYVTPKQALQYVSPLIQEQVKPYSFEHSVGYKAPPPVGYVKESTTSGVLSHTQYAWNFGDGENDVYYSYIGRFRTDATPPPGCGNGMERAPGQADCLSAISGHLTCHLFMFDNDRHLIAVQPLNIPQPANMKGKPACYNVLAMAPAAVVKDGMLIVANYHDSTWRCSNGPMCAADIEKPDLFPITFLVRFAKDAMGKLILSQDTTCLGNPNNFKTIAEARRALKQAKCN